MDRRRFLQSMALLLAAGCTSGRAGATQDADPLASQPATAESTSTESTSAEPTSIAPLDAPEVDLLSDPFGLGVASGSPTGEAVVLWTRLVGDLPPSVPVIWEVATDASFDVLVATGETGAVEPFGHSIHVDVLALPPATTFAYRFRAGSFTSAVGTTRTMPTAGAVVESIRLGFSSCQLIETGHYAAHRNIAETPIDAVVWLGDFIYEYVLNSGTEVRPIGGEEAVTLDDYRSRYTLYRTDPLLQASSAAHPWFMTWDDHEVDNDYSRALDPERTSAAYQAWWENMPVRIAPPAEVAPTIYDATLLGNLVNLVVLDCRQDATSETLLSEEQWTWFEQQLATPAIWTVIASSVLASGTGVNQLDNGLLSYTWAGYPAEHQRLAGLLATVANPIIVSGDMHTAMELGFLANFDLGEPVLATEFMAPAISSPFWDDYVDLAPALRLVSPTVRYIEPTNGWLELDFTTTDATPTFHFVDDVTDPDSSIHLETRAALTAS